MSEGFDFERYWLNKLAACLDVRVGEGVGEAVMAGSGSLSDATDRGEVISWTQEALERLVSLADEVTARAVMAGCACEFPKDRLQEMKERYAATGDLEVVHGMLQSQFEAFLGQGLGLGEEVVAEVVSRGWGAAGVLQGEVIVATKIPKSGHLVEYLEEPDLDKRRRLYCHCPRIRNAMALEQAIPPIYCYCGAGYYQGIWEEILRRPVRVEVVESVLAGGEVCCVAIHVGEN